MLCFGQPAALHKKKGGSRGMMNRQSFTFRARRLVKSLPLTAVIDAPNKSIEVVNRQCDPTFSFTGL